MTEDDVLANFAAGRDYLDRKAASIAQCEALRQEMLRDHQEWEQADNAWSAAFDAWTRGEGKRPKGTRPTRPDPQIGQDVAAVIRAEEESVRMDRARTLALLQEPIIEFFKAREKQRYDKCRSAVETLETARVDEQADASMVRQVLATAQSQAAVVTHPSPAERMITTIGLDVFVQAVADDRSLMEPQPMPSRKESAFDSDDPAPFTLESTGETTRLGLRADNKRVFGVPDWPRSTRGRSSPGVNI